MAYCYSAFLRSLYSLAFLRAYLSYSVVLRLLMVGLNELALSLASYSFYYSYRFFFSFAAYFACSFFYFARPFIYFWRSSLTLRACSSFSSFSLYLYSFFLASSFGFSGYRFGLAWGTVGFGFVFSFAFFCSWITSSNFLFKSILTYLAFTSAILFIYFSLSSS